LWARKTNFRRSGSLESKKSGEVAEREEDIKG
jgi:hypothetical protein